MTKRVEFIVVDGDWSFWKQTEEASITIRDLYPKANIALIVCIWLAWATTAFLLSIFVL